MQSSREEPPRQKRERERKTTKSRKMWALLETHHDSDNGPLSFDFDHRVTVHATESLAKKAMKEAREKVLESPLSLTNDISVDAEDMVVFASDDWWQWKIIPVEVAS